MREKRINVFRVRHMPWLIKEMREASGLTQEELAKLMGVTRQTISRWEVGQDSPSPRHFEKLIRVIREYSERR